MIILVIAFTTLHVCFYLILAHGWRKIPATDPGKSMKSFSVIIPVRNEESNIEHLLQRLENQNYPKEFYEVIVADDFSDDQTVSIVENQKELLNINLSLVNLTDPAKQGKKHALTAAIKASKFEIMLTTDADCSPGVDWIKSYNEAFEHEINMLAGPVAIQGEGIFAKLQQIEFAGLIGFGAVTISKEDPSMCSGANLGFRKKAFEAVGGYENNLFTPSGDDEFLLFNIMRRFPNTTGFLKDNRALVNTKAHLKLRSFLNQRTRWTSKWKFNKNWKVRLSAVLFFLDNLIFYGAIAASLVGHIGIGILLSICSLRFISILIFLNPINRFLKGNSTFFPLLALQIIYPMHVLFMGMNSIFGSYTWKGRKYR